MFDKSERRDGTFTRSDFAYDHDGRCSTPARPASSFGYARRSIGRRGRSSMTTGMMRYRASKLDCDACALKPQCCPNTPARKIPRSIHEGARDMARDIATTEDYVTSRRQRKKVEMLFAHLKRILRLDRLRLRGPNGARDEFHLAATAQNLRKLAKLVPMPRQPWREAQGCLLSGPSGRNRQRPRTDLFNSIHWKWTSNLDAVRLRVAQLCRNVGQPNHVLANPIIGQKAERRPGSGEIWFAVAKHDGVQVDSILIDQAKFGEALRQVRASNFDLSVALGLQLADRALKIILNKPGIRADRFQRARDDPFRLVPPGRREGVFVCIPFRMIFVPVTHDLIHLATVHTACLPLSLRDKVAKERGTRRKRRMVDVAVQGLVHSKNEYRHASNPHSRDRPSPVLS